MSLFDKPKKPPDEFDVWFAPNDVKLLLAENGLDSDDLFSFAFAANAENDKLLLVGNGKSVGLFVVCVELVGSAKLMPVLLFVKPNEAVELIFFSKIFSTGVDVCVGSFKFGEFSVVTAVIDVVVGNLNVKPVGWFVSFDVFVSAHDALPLNIFVVGGFELDIAVASDTASNNGFESGALPANRIIRFGDISRFRKVDHNFFFYLVRLKDLRMKMLSSQKLLRRKKKFFFLEIYHKNHIEWDSNYNL